MTTLTRLLDPYIALMMLTIAFAAIVPAHGQGATIAGLAANAGIVFLFFLYGARLSPETALLGLRHWRLHVAVLLSTFALFPLLGLCLGLLPESVLPHAFFTGILFLSVLPSTVQSSIAFTSIARGNVPAALCAASLSNLIGIVLTPLLAGFLLKTNGVHISFDAVRDIVLQLLAPFLAGQLLHRWIAATLARHRRILGYADRGSILLIIYVAFSKGVVDHIWSRLSFADLATLVAFLLLLLAAALAITKLAAERLLCLRVEDEIVLQFCGSKKSLASGLPMAGILFPGPQLGLIILPLMLFHQFQLIACAVLAKRYDRRP